MPPANRNNPKKTRRMVGSGSLVPAKARLAMAARSRMDRGRDLGIERWAYFGRLFWRRSFNFQRAAGR